MKVELESDKIFIDELEKGFSYQKIVNEFFISKGFKTKLDPLKIREERSVINKFTDTGDLKIILPKRTIIVEVKSRDVLFTDVHDFPYDTIFVDRVNTWKRKNKNKPHAIIIISQITKNMFVIPVSGEADWINKTVYDNKRDYTREYYLVNRENLKPMDEFITWLNKQNYEN
jgi:hypothetical protein